MKRRAPASVRKRPPGPTIQENEFIGNGLSINPLALSFALVRASAVLTNRLDRSLSGLHGLGFQDFSILYHLSRAQGHRLRRIDLARRLELTPSGVTRSLLPLEKRGLVEREADPNDARAAFASLSKSGKRLLSDAQATAQQVSAECFLGVPSTQADTLHAALGGLAGMNLSNT